MAEDGEAPPEEEPVEEKGEFRKYLEEGGVVDAWAKCLVGLYGAEERPELPIEFVEEWFGDKKNAEIAELEAKVAALEENVASQSAEIEAIKAEAVAAEEAAAEAAAAAAEDEA
jgi:hypothetical protein